MPIRKAKIYFDGSHYIAIPPTTRPRQKRKRKPIKYLKEVPVEATDNKPTLQSKIIDLKEEFNTLYKAYAGKKRKEKKREIINGLKPYFKDERKTKEFVNTQLERVKRNEIVRKTRLSRKMNNTPFNYFITFTYDSKIHTEETFKKKFTNFLKHAVSRKDWRYIGVWERGNETQRLHFHGVFYIPENKMIGELFEKHDYSTTKHRMQKTIQNTHFNKHFGRTDFEEIICQQHLQDCMKYLKKYIQKSGEKLIISKNVYTYFISDLLEEDMLCTIGQEDRKILLFDNFRVIKDGEILGVVSARTKDLADKCN